MKWRGFLSRVFQQPKRLQDVLFVQKAIREKFVEDACDHRLVGDPLILGPFLEPDEILFADANIDVPSFFRLVEDSFDFRPFLPLDGDIFGTPGFDVFLFRIEFVPSFHGRLRIVC